MKTPTSYTKMMSGNDGVSSLIEYITISGIMMIVLIITMLSVPNVMILQPSATLNYYSFADIANGVSTRIVDVYAIPSDTYTTISIVSKYDIPDTVAGKGYTVDIEGTVISERSSIGEWCN